MIFKKSGLMSEKNPFEVFLLQTYPGLPVQALSVYTDRQIEGETPCFITIKNQRQADNNKKL